MRSKSSIVHVTPAECAIARKCSTALVDPPTAMTTLTAFSIASRVTIWRGRICFSMARTSTAADVAALSAFSRSGLAIVDEYGRLMPSASNADDMVFAVNMPPQAPVPGSALRSMPSKSSFDSLPAVNSPTASNGLTMVRSLPL